MEKVSVYRTCTHAVFYWNTDDRLAGIRFLHGITLEHISLDEEEFGTDGLGGHVYMHTHAPDDHAHGVSVLSIKCHI